MLGNEIIVSSPNMGHFTEGVISGALLPGTILQLQAGTAVDGGNRHTYEAWNPGGDGYRGGGPVAILLADKYRGRTYADAYTSGARGFIYIPEPGEELNVRRSNISGTSSASEDISIGENLLIVSGTGYVSPVVIGVAAQTPLAYHFKALEAITDPGMTPGGVTASTEHDLVWCVFKGNSV